MIKQIASVLASAVMISTPALAYPTTNRQPEATPDRTDYIQEAKARKAAEDVMQALCNVAMAGGTAGLDMAIDVSIEEMLMTPGGIPVEFNDVYRNLFNQAPSRCPAYEHKFTNLVKQHANEDPETTRYPRTHEMLTGEPVPGEVIYQRQPHEYY
jgi:hypothetical protein